MAELITSLTLIFVSSALTLYVARKLSQPAIPAYIIAGIFVGFQVNQSELLGLTQMGIAFLVFIFGLKFDPEKLKAVESEALSLNTLQVILVGLVSFSFAQIIGLNMLQSSYFAVAATLSSSLVGLELISDEVDKRLIHGRLAESINLVQDILALIALTVLSSPVFTPLEIGSNILIAAGLLLSALLVRRFFFERIAELAEGSRELLMLTGISFLTGFIALSQLSDLSIVVGSFAAGVAVARFPHNLEILDTIGSLKDFFSAIFFVTLGALISAPDLLTLILTAFVIFFTSIIKPFMMIFSLIHQGYDPRTSFITGVSLDQVSEFSLIIAIQGWIAGTISEPLFNAIILSATITMTTSAYTMKYDNRLFELLERFNFVESEREAMPEKNFEEKKDHVILVGFDTQGKRLAEKLNEMDVEFVVVENDPEKISELRNREENFVYGNVLNRETWRHAEQEEAELVVSTVPFPRVSERILGMDLEPEVILRAEELEEAERLLEKGAVYVIVPEILTAELLRDHLMGLESEENYVEELRRRNLLEVRRYLEEEEG